jgi:putative hydrolase of the HAD superfamily
MAVLLDALGTLVRLEPPAPRLRALLAREGHEVSEARAAAAFGAEISYYLDHHLDGGTVEGLDDLRDRCAGVLSDALELPSLPHADARRAMLGALSFRPYPDALPALRALRERGQRLVIVSNWDMSLPRWIAGTGLLELVDGVVTSASAGCAKPGREIFEQGLALAGARADESTHVGDSLDKDVEGALGAGIRPVLVARAGERPPEGVEAIATLAELPALL